MTPYILTIRQNSSAKIVLRSHNLEHLIWERLANSTGNKAKKIYLKHLASKLKKYEKRTINEVDGIAAISFEDTERFKKFKCQVPIVTIPFGIDLEKYQPLQQQTNSPLRLFHIGAMDWEPNKEAVNWLLDDIWPSLSTENIELNLAGKKMPRYILDQADQKLIVHGEVEDAIAFIKNHDILIAPLLSGSGMRVKIIEAMGCGKTVITTAVGAEGINYKHNENILIANSSSAFIEEIKKLINQPKLAQKIGENARILVANEYDNTQIIKKLIHFYESI
jgi:glycosyltransferase involved in cell wall biosynthesis